MINLVVNGRKIKKLNNIIDTLRFNMNITIPSSGVFTEDFYKDHKVFIRGLNLDYGGILKIILYHKKPVKATFSISKENIASKSKRLIGIDDILTGDKKFDKSILLEGENYNAVIALLHSELRRMILKLSNKSYKLKINERKIDLCVSVNKFSKRKSIEQFINTLIIISETITGERKLKREIIKKLNSDFKPPEMINAINLLVDQFGLDSDVKRILNKNINHKNVGVKVACARYLKRKGHRYIFDLATKTLDLKEDERILIIKYFKEKTYKTNLPLLFYWLRETKSKKVKLQILDTLQSYKIKNRLDFLFENLQSEEGEIRLKIIETLGCTGTLDSIEKLYKVGKESLSLRVRSSVQKSIKMIQSRLGKIDTGWLSFPETDNKDGALSLADRPEEGALSIKKKKK